MSVEGNDNSICSTCPFEGGCISSRSVWHAEWVFRNDLRDDIRDAYQSSMEEAGIEVKPGRVCIQGLAAKYPEATPEWLAERTYLLHHEIASTEAEKVDAK